MAPLTVLTRRSLCCLAAMIWPSIAVASLDQATLHSGDEQKPVIKGGQAAEVCEWPSAVSISIFGSSTCTATLVHPEIVLYAAHCPPRGLVMFGDQRQARSVGVDHCKRFIETSTPTPDDYAYCKLSEPVTDVPITPVLFGCEAERYLQTDADVWLAGFGRTDPNSNEQGIKYWGQTKINSVGDNFIWLGDENVAPLNGDSGGPAFLQLIDGSWRAVGIVSGGPPGGGNSLYVRMDSIVEWVETESGVDITPCFDVDGTWNPNEECGAFATKPQSGGSWAMGCSENDPLSAYSASCGDPHEGEDDQTAPIIRVTSPTEGQIFDETQVTLDIEVEVEDPNLESLWLEVDGQKILELNAGPYIFRNLNFDSGAYTIQVWGEDYWGNLGESRKVGIGVGGETSPEFPDQDSESDGGTEEGGTESDSESDSEENSKNENATSDKNDKNDSPEDDGSSGCSVSVSKDYKPGLWIGILLTGLLISRRRRF